MKKSMVSVALLGAILFAPVSHAEDASVKVGILPLAPFGGDGPSYFSELMDRVSAEAGFKIEYRQMVLGELWPSLARKQIDIVAAPIAIAPSAPRREFAATQSVLPLADGLLVPASDTRAYGRLADLRGMPIGIIAGADSYDTALRGAGVTEVNTYPVFPPMYEALRKGEIKGALLSAWFVNYSQQEKGLFPDIRLVSGYQPSLTVQIPLFVRTSDTELLASLDAALGKLKDDGFVGDLNRKWRVPGEGPAVAVAEPAPVRQR